MCTLDKYQNDVEYCWVKDEVFLINGFRPIDYFYGKKDLIIHIINKNVDSGSKT